MSGGAGGTGNLRRRRALDVWQNRFGPNMTPMVDIVLVILIFFMAGTTFLGQEWFLKSAAVTEARQAGKPDPLELPPVRLRLRLGLDEQGRTVVNGLGDASLTLEALAARLGEFAKGTEKRQIEVLMSPAATVPYRDVVRVHEACAAAGIDKVGIGGEP